VTPWAGLLALALAQATPVAGRPACQKELAQATLAEGSFQSVNAAPFGGKVYLYVPPIPRNWLSFNPFQVWVVEGVYGRPFAQNSGKMDAATFGRIRTSANVRSTAIAVSASSPRGRAGFRISKDTFVAEVMKVNVPLIGAPSVTVRVCR
jgi:hypothetical protein